MGNLVSLFNVDELKDLASECGAATDEIVGDTVLKFGLNLIDWAEKNDKLYEVMLAVIKARPQSRWD